MSQEEDPRIIERIDNMNKTIAKLIKANLDLINIVNSLNERLIRLEIFKYFKDSK